MSFRNIGYTHEALADVMVVAKYVTYGFKFPLRTLTLRQ